MHSGTRWRPGCTCLHSSVGLFATLDPRLSCDPLSLDVRSLDFSLTRCPRGEIIASEVEISWHCRLAAGRVNRTRLVNHLVGDHGVRTVRPDHYLLLWTVPVKPMTTGTWLSDPRGRSTQERCAPSKRPVHWNTPPSHAAAADPRWPPPSPNSLRGAPNAAAAETLRRESAQRVDYFSLEYFTSWFSALFKQLQLDLSELWLFAGNDIGWYTSHMSFHLIDQTIPMHAFRLHALPHPKNNLFQASRAALDWTLHWCSKSNLNQTPLSSRSLCLDFGKLETST